MRTVAFLLLLAGGAGAADLETEGLLTQIDAEVVALREGGRGGEAEALAAEVRALRGRLREGGAPAVSGRTELHVVYAEGGARTVAVRVSVGSRPVVLVLGSHGPVTWHVEIDADVRKILTIGTPDRLVIATPRARVEALRGATLGNERPDPEVLVREVEAASGDTVWTVLGAGAADPTVLVGPGNPEWTAQHVRAETRFLHARATRARRAAEREALKAVRFGALYHWRDAGNPEPSFRASFGDWTPLGPLFARHHVLPDSLAVASAAVRDDERGDLYLLRYGVLLRYALPSGPPEVLRVPDTLPQVREPCALAVDTRRQRLLLATKHDHGYLYALDLTSREWSVVSDMDDIDAAGMAYDEQRDAILCLEYSERHGVRLHRLSPEEGRCQHEIVLRLPPLPGSRPLVASCAKGRLVILCPPLPGREYFDAEESRTFVIEPHSGDVLFAERTRAWEDFEPLGEPQLEEQWNEMMGRDAARAGRAMRSVAGQGDRSVAFLARRLSPEPGADEEFGRWVRLLAADDPLVRDLAQYRLVEAGPRVLEFLAGIDREELPPEARRRLGSALKAVGGQERLRRDLRAVQVLEWIGTAAAEALLRDLAAKGEPRRRAAASDALARIDRPRR